MQIPRRKPLAGNVAIISVGLNTYWKQFPGLLEVMEQKSAVLEEKLKAQGQTAESSSDNQTEAPEKEDVVPQENVPEKPKIIKSDDTDDGVALEPDIEENPPVQSGFLSEFYMSESDSPDTLEADDEPVREDSDEKETSSSLQEADEEQEDFQQDSSDDEAAANVQSQSVPTREIKVERFGDNGSQEQKNPKPDSGFDDFDLDDDFRSLLKNEISKKEKARQKLSRLGIDVLSKDANSVTSLMTALSEQPSVDLIEAFVDAGADVNACDDNAVTPLMYALMHGASAEVINVLLSARVDVNARDKDSFTILMKAVLYSQDIQILSSLLAVGADVNARTDIGMTALMFAAASVSDASIIQLLLRYGALADEQAEDGMTALMFAARDNANPDVLNALLEKDVDTKKTDLEGKSALDYAKENEALKDTKAYWHLNDMSF